MEQQTPTHKHIKLTFIVCEKQLNTHEVIEIAKNLATICPHSDIDIELIRSHFCVEVTTTNIAHHNNDNSNA